MTDHRLVPPDVVRVWRGFWLPSLELAAFHGKLGSVFVPATVLMQIDAGLCAYTPTVPAGLPGKHDGVPDETAIRFWDSQETVPLDGAIACAGDDYLVYWELGPIARGAKRRGEP